jgi:hypothetical protein
MATLELDRLLQNIPERHQQMALACFLQRQLMFRLHLALKLTLGTFDYAYDQRQRK